MELDKKLIGHTFKPFTTTVEAGKIRLFCKAIGEEDPIYTDEAAAKAAGYRGITAPLTFLRALQADDPNKGGLLRLLNVDIGLILHGEQHFEYFAPVVVGDKVTCQEKVVDIYDKKGGALWFVVQEMEMKDQTGKLVAKGKHEELMLSSEAYRRIFND